MNLKEFSKVNLDRCQSSSGFNHSLGSWSTAEWTNAIAGEVGEACNLAKKILRHRDGVTGNYKEEDKDLQGLKVRTAEELADAIVYCDLAIQSLGFDTSKVLENVFNNKSEQLKAPFFV